MSPEEKSYLKELVQKELDHFAKEQKTLYVDNPARFLKGAHDYKHFLEELLKKLQ